MNYISNVAAALSQLLNAVVFCGDPNETISGRCHREGRHTAEALIDTLFFFQPSHCELSHWADHVFARKIINED